MSNLAYPVEIKLFARGLYIQGHSYSDTAKLVKRQYPKARCNAETIRRWATAVDEEGSTWDNLRHAVSTQVVEKQKGDAVKLLEQHTELYQEMIKKGAAGIKDKKVPIRSAGEAASILHTGIQGQRGTLRELISMNFVKAVFEIILEEVSDEQIRRQIAFRLRELSKQTFQGGE